jgi:tetratricopeptide (TPR) repeat protein
MRAHLPFLAILVVASSGCYTPPEAAPQTRLGAPERSEVVLQAVDAGTGTALSDDEMTVRYLVRAPITFDATTVRTVSSVEPFRIAHEVAESTLVLEVRLEAESYHRLDTVVTVARGASAGPLTMRLSPRLDLLAEELEPEPPPPERAPIRPVGEDRTALRQGDAAFAAGDWFAATEAYRRMPVPRGSDAEYARLYVEAKTREGIAHMNRSEYARALEVLEEAADLESPPPRTYLRLAEAQCAVGRTEEGRGTLAQLSRTTNRLSPVEQNVVAALIAYGRGVCTHGEFERARTTRERVRTGAAAMEELQAFVQGAEQMAPRPPEVERAMADASRRVEEIRRTVGG